MIGLATNWATLPIAAAGDTLGVAGERFGKPSRLEPNIMNKHSAMLPRWSIALLGLLALTGCWQGPADRLIGRWQGRPAAADDQPATILEAFDFTISLDFVNAREVTMAFGEGENNRSRSGTWQVTEGAGDRFSIEISAAAQASDSSTVVTTAANAAAPGREIRRFKIHFFPETDDQFTLTEDGADSEFGEILFQRVDAR